MVKIIECVPNFSEGRDLSIIEKITAEITKVKNVKLLDVDPGFDTNRTVVTFVGTPKAVQEAAFNAIKKSHELIDMRKHKGAHPRFGACDVCPLIPVSDTTMEECVEYAHELGKKLGEELDFPVYFYENAATKKDRKNLANVRAGEYEGLEEKLKNPEWKPDAGSSEFKPTKGATAVSARDFLIAYNINLNTVNYKKANYIAFRIREKGYTTKDKNGNKIKQPGKFTNCKAIGWYVDDYKRAQISINLTNYKITSMHEVFDECSRIAETRGLRVTGSELVGVLPKQALIDAGIHYLKKQGMSTGQSEKELIKIAIQSMGLNDVAPFKPEEKIIEYMLEDNKKLSKHTISDFSDLLASDAPAPGGGSVAALCGNLAAALGSMVANLTFNKKGYTQFNDKMDEIALKMQHKRTILSELIDEDTTAFNKMMNARKQLKSANKSGNDEAIIKAEKDMRNADEYAITIPMSVLKTTQSLLSNIKFVAINGNKNAVSDAGVSALLIQAGVKSAALNVKINLSSFEKDDPFKEKIVSEMNLILESLDDKVNEILKITEERIAN